MNRAIRIYVRYGDRPAVISLSWRYPLKETAQWTSRPLEWFREDFTPIHPDWAPWSVLYNAYDPDVEVPA